MFQFDFVLKVNGVEISGMTHEQAVQFLRQCDNDVLLRLRRELDRTPADLSPTDTSPNSSFRPKPNLRYVLFLNANKYLLMWVFCSRQEAVDMLSDLAARKLCSSSPCTSPRHLRQDPGASHFESLYFETGELHFLTFHYESRAVIKYVLQSLFITYSNYYY